jgi:hypothetical protein
VSHPSLGLPPRDLCAGFPDAAARLTADRHRFATRALEIAVAADPSFRERYDELGLRRLLNDALVLIDTLAVAVASADPGHLAHWADVTVPVYRRRRVPLDDLVSLADGIRAAVATALAPEERALVDDALDGAISRWRKDRRLGGDARRRNRILAAIYKGA